MKTKMVQRVCIWYSYSKGEEYRVCLQELTQLFGGDRISERSIRRWWKSFRDGTRTKDNLSDKLSTGRPKSARTDENCAVVLEHVLADRRVSIPQLSDATGLSMGSIHKILKKDLKMSRVCAKFVPRVLRDDERTHRMLVSQEWLQKIEDDPDIINKIITADESWVWLFDPESKKESSQWIRRHIDPRPKKALHARSTKKLLILPFFDIEGLIHVEYLQGTVTSEVYIEALMHLRDQIRVKRPEKWRTHDWILLDDNASPHKSYDTLAFHRQSEVSEDPTHLTARTWPLVIFFCSPN